MSPQGVGEVHRAVHEISIILHSISSNLLRSNDAPIDLYENHLERLTRWHQMLPHTYSSLDLDFKALSTELALDDDAVEKIKFMNVCPFRPCQISLGPTDATNSCT